MPKQPNIIVLVLDTQRADRMSLYGHRKDTTPVINEFARGGTVFDWAISPAAWTVPSHASLFTGLYPTVHQTQQSFHTIPSSIPTLPELLRDGGYETIAFCNNPLVGVLDNGMRRGFNQFINYSGTIPDIPDVGGQDTLRTVLRHSSRLLQRITTPIERLFGSSPLLLKLATLEFIVPIWSRMFNFKGDTHRSLRDMSQYVRHYFAGGHEKPLFMFINMMEAHLPYFPPKRVLNHWVPALRKDREARDFMRVFNTQSYRWMAPIIDPLSEMEEAVLRDVYDAETAYQDEQLHGLFRALEQSGELDNTMVVILADHGESHSEHNFMGHAFVVYNELVRVPLVIRYPEGFPADRRVSENVSTRRVFHTALDVAGIPYEGYGHTAGELSLRRVIEGTPDPEDEFIVSEGFPPQNFIDVMEMSHPEAIEQFRVRALRRAIYDGKGHKLMTLNGQPDEFFAVYPDPLETHNLLDNPFGHENTLLSIEKLMEAYTGIAEAYRDGTAAGQSLEYSSNPELLERLKNLGYIE